MSATTEEEEEEDDDAASRHLRAETAPLLPRRDARATPSLATPFCPPPPHNQPLLTRPLPPALRQS